MAIFYFQLKNPCSCDPLPGKDDEDFEVLEKSPTLDLRTLWSKQVIDSTVRKFISFYFHRDLGEISEANDLLCIEQSYYAWLEDREPKDIEYGRIFVDKKGNGGMTDQGITMWLLVQDLTDALGIDVSNSNNYPIVLNNMRETFLNPDKITNLIEDFYFLNQFYHLSTNSTDIRS